MTEGKYIRFDWAYDKPKTAVWNVIAKEGNVLLGQVMWFARWRGYAFFPQPNTVFEHVCLTDLATFLKHANKLQRNKHKKENYGTDSSESSR